MKYFDIESREIVTVEQLKAELEMLIEDGNIEQMTIEEYLKECTGKNGTLIPVYDVETIG